MARRLLQVDLLKGAAIVAVVIMHGMAGAQQLAVGTAFHVAQAVPVFFLLMAYNARNSFHRAFAEKPLADIYRSAYLRRRLGRLLAPLIGAAAVASAIGAARGVHLYVGPLTPLLWMPVPLVGQFFISVSVAFVVLAPVLYAAYRRAPGTTVLACVLADLAFEVIAPHVPVFSATYYLYQVVPLRFLALFGLGMWLADGADPRSARNRFVLPFAVASLAYLSAFQVGLRLPLMNAEHMYNVVAAGYPLLIVSAGLTWLPASTTGVALRALASIGRASYHVFLVQAVWFSSPLTIVTYGDWRWFPVSILVCCGLGWSWYHLEQRYPWRRTPAETSDGPLDVGVQVD